MPLNIEHRVITISVLLNVYPRVSHDTEQTCNAGNWRGSCHSRIKTTAICLYVVGLTNMCLNGMVKVIPTPSEAILGSYSSSEYGGLLVLMQQ
jgi:hypothetical protein